MLRDEVPCHMMSCHSLWRGAMSYDELPFLMTRCNGAQWQCCSIFFVDTTQHMHTRHPHHKNSAKRNRQQSVEAVSMKLSLFLGVARGEKKLWGYSLPIAHISCRLHFWGRFIYWAHIWGCLQNLEMGRKKYLQEGFTWWIWNMRVALISKAEKPECCTTQRKHFC